MRCLILFFFLLSSLIAHAEIDARQFANEQTRQDYESIISELRCLVCQNQTIADSNAELAADLRRQVYEMLNAGKDKQTILQFMTERYGDFVLYNPPFKAKTSLLWLAPIGFLIIGIASLFWFIYQRKKSAVDLNDKKQQSEKLSRIRQLLEEERS